MGIHVAKGSSSLSSCWLLPGHQCATASQGARAPWPSSIHVCREPFWGPPRGSRQCYQLEPDWKGLKVKPTRGMIHGVPTSTEIQLN